MNEPLADGTLLHGRYRIERLLGTGSFGHVYLAVDTHDAAQTHVAIKELLDARFASPGEKDEAVTWFKREVSTLLTLAHPGIPAMHGYWTAATTSGPFYLVMDYIPGATLEAVLRASGGRIPWRQVAQWGIALCEILAYLHDREPPFVFRDMKLSNVMLDSRTDRPVLIDFGITRQLAPSGGTAIGTWGYVPFEQVLGRAEPRSDLYALGATLHALLTGRHPDVEYIRMQRGGLDVECTMRALFPAVHTLDAQVPIAISRVLERATAFAAADRFADARAMGAALQHALDRPNDDALPVAGAASAVRPSALPYGTSRLVVAQDGCGDAVTIGQALRGAPEGARIEVQPGCYRETVLIDKPVEIVALGSVEETIIETLRAPCLVMRTETALVRGFTLRALRRPITTSRAIVPLQAEGIGTWLTRLGYGIGMAIKSATAPFASTLGELLDGGPCHAIDISRGQPIIEDCCVTSTSPWCVVAIHGPDANPVLRCCIVHNGSGAGILFYDVARGAMVNCSILSHRRAGIEITERSNPTLRHCTIRDGQANGIHIYEWGKGLIEDCGIHDNARDGIVIERRTAPAIRACRIRGNGGKAIATRGKNSATIEHCDVDRH